MISNNHSILFCYLVIFALEYLKLDKYTHNLTRYMLHKYV